MDNLNLDDIDFDSLDDDTEADDEELDLDGILEDDEEEADEDEIDFGDDEPEADDDEPEADDEDDEPSIDFGDDEDNSAEQLEQENTAEAFNTSANEEMEPAEEEMEPAEEEMEPAEEEMDSSFGLDDDLDIDTADLLGADGFPTDTLEDDMLSNEDDMLSNEDDMLSNEDDNISEDVDDYTDGTLVDNESLLDDEEIPMDESVNFISDTGDVVVMDNKDDGDGFRLEYIDIESIVIVHRIRKTDNVDDLVRSIKSTGLIEPIVVGPTATEGLYVLLAGYRRIVACARAGKRRIPCIINSKVSTEEIPVLEAMYNHCKKYSIKEQIDYIDYLEKQKGIMSASMIEYLLQMNSGDYTKLKDILNDNDDDIVDKLLNGQYDIATAFRKLEQRRKKESLEEKENRKAAAVYNDTEESGMDKIEGSGEEAEPEAALTDEEISNLAISASELNSSDDEDVEEMLEEANNIEGFKPHKQDPNNRERLDPVLRKSVLARDNNTCKICEQISGMEYTEVLDVHHIQEVYLGGTDDINNLITACTCCHKLIHLFGRGELNIRPFEEMDEAEQKKFKRIIKLGTIIRKGMALKGMKVEELKKKDNADTIGRRLKGSSDQVAG